MKRLSDEWDAFLKTNPYEVVAEFDSEAQCHAAVIRIRAEPPLRLGAILGDLLHNLRSSLDYVAWAVAGLSNSPQVLKRNRASIYFPITQTAKEFANHKLMPFIREDAKAVFERLQPYNGSKGAANHPLTSLSRLSNRDKHRLLHAAFGALDMATVTFRPGAIDHTRLDGVSIEVLLKHGDSVDEGTKIAYIRFPGEPDPHGTHVKVERQPRIDIVFADAPRVFGWFDLGDLCAHTRAVIEQFVPLFPGTAH